jgi:uncharacterized repeat protein (TIGR03803 family)
MVRFWVRGGVVLLGVLATLNWAHAQQLTILHQFGDGMVVHDGVNPEAAMVRAPDGLLYGTTTMGGTAGEGTIFKMSATGQITILHNFGDGSVPNDGRHPGGNLIVGKSISTSDFTGTFLHQEWRLCSNRQVTRQETCAFRRDEVLVLPCRSTRCRFDLRFFFRA